MAARLHPLGHLTKRNGIYYAVVYDRAGQRHRISTKVSDKKVAERRLRELEAELHDPSGLSPEAKEHTVGLALEALLSDGCREVTESTTKMYRLLAGHLARSFRETPVNALTRKDVLRHLEMRRAEGAASATLSKELVTLRRALRIAFDRELLKLHPSQILPDYTHEYTPRRVWLSEAELAQLLMQLPAKRRRWVQFAVHTGCRRSELEALRWEDIQGNFILVRGTKTDGAHRWLPIGPSLAQLLEQTPKKDRHGPLVEPWMNAVRDLKAASLVALGADKDGKHLKRIVPHDLRRTFASWLKQAGHDSFHVGMLLGHSSSQMVERVYGHLGRETLAEVVKSLPMPGVSAVSQTEAESRDFPDSLDSTSA